MILLRLTESFRGREDTAVDRQTFGQLPGILPCLLKVGVDSGRLAV